MLHANNVLGISIVSVNWLHAHYVSSGNDTVSVNMSIFYFA